MVINSLDYWVDQLANRSSNTKRLYLIQFNKFLEYMGKDPDQLIEMQKTAKTHKGDLRENQVLEGKVRGFMQYLEEKGYAINSCKLAYSAVLSFFECNLYPLKMRSQDRPNGEATGSRIPEKEEIVRMLNSAKSRSHRSAILVLKDSGLRLSDVVRLKWSEKIDYGEGFWGWKVLTRKRKVLATAFVGPETTEALKQLNRKDERIFPVGVIGLGHSISEIAKSAGLKGVTAHGLRKFFNVELQSARVPKEWRYEMMGKKTGAYDEKREAKLFEAYREAYDHLRVFGAVNVEVSKLQQSLEGLRAENKELREQQAEKGDQIMKLQMVLNSYSKYNESLELLRLLMLDPKTKQKFLDLLKEDQT